MHYCRPESRARLYDGYMTKNRKRAGYMFLPVRLLPLATPDAELLVQPHLRPQTLLHLPLDAQAALTERQQPRVGLLTHHLDLADVRNVDPLAAGNISGEWVDSPDIGTIRVMCE